MQATAAPPTNDHDAEDVDPAYAAALAGTLRAVFDHMAVAAGAAPGRAGRSHAIKVPGRAALLRDTDVSHDTTT